MNILLNNYCNQSCEYCFAKDVLAENRTSMSMEDFRWLLDFTRKSNISEVRIIGGEPTLHPHFEEMILEAMRQPFIRHLQLFTNGTFSDNICYLLYLMSFDKHISILLNYNSSENISKQQSARLEKNLKSLSNSRVDITLGINFYKDNQDYSYIIDACKKYNIKNVRWALTVPNSPDKRKSDVQDYYLRNKQLLLDFMTDCIKNGLQPHVDCNNTPLCLLDDDAIRLLAMVSPDNLRTSVCSPILDVKPNMEAIRCFVFGDSGVDVRKFNNIQELQKYFVETVDSKYMNKPLFDACEGCASYQLRGQSCGCLAFREVNSNEQ